MISRLSLESKLEKFISFSFYGFIIIGLVLLWGDKDWWPSFYTPTFFGWVFLASAFFTILPKHIFKTENSCKRGAVVQLSSAIALSSVLNGLGELYLYRLYQYGIQYDKLLHFSITFLSIIVLTYFLEIWKQLPFRRALSIAVIAALAGSVVWELFEFFSDLLFKTSEFGVYGQYKFSDTFFDGVADVLGIVLSSIYQLASTRRKRAIVEYRDCPAVK